MQIGRLKIHYTYNDKKYEQLNDMLCDMTYEDLKDFNQKTTQEIEKCEEKRKSQLNEKLFAKGLMIGGIALSIASPLAGGILKSLSMLAIGLTTSITGHFVYKRKNVKQLVYKLKLIHLKYMQRESSNEIVGRLNGTSKQSKILMQNRKEVSEENKTISDTINPQLNIEEELETNAELT